MGAQLWQLQRCPMSCLAEAVEITPSCGRSLPFFLGARKIMTLKIERISGKRRARIRLIGQFRSDRLDQVKAEISHGGPAVLDLEEVDLVDVEAIRFLNAREDEGISVLHCSPYIREWMLREREEEKGRTDWR
jgi:hypothetical protein